MRNARVSDVMDFGACTKGHRSHIKNALPLGVRIKLL